MVTVDFEEYEGVHLCNVFTIRVPTHLQMFDSLMINKGSFIRNF